jgi:hypothetical protein
MWYVLDSEQVTTFTAPAPAAPAIQSPTTGDTLISGSATVTWDAMGTVPKYSFLLQVLLLDFL